MSGSNDEILELINNKFEEFKVEMKEEIQDMKSQVTELKEILECKVGVISKLEEEVCFLKAKCLKLENLVDEEDSYVRRESLIFSGPMTHNDDQNENCSEFIRGRIKSKMNIELNANEISVTHRLGPKSPAQGPDKRAITVRFIRRDRKREILFTKRDNVNHDSALFVSESLTPKRRTIHFALRQIKKKCPTLITGYSTLDGRVFAYTKTPRSIENSRKFDLKHVINTHEALVEFCREYIKQPLEDFLESWSH